MRISLGNWINPDNADEEFIKVAENILIQSIRFNAMNNSQIYDRFLQNFSFDMFALRVSIENSMENIYSKMNYFEKTFN